jgi:hypothetical protein
VTALIDQCAESHCFAAWQIEAFKGFVSALSIRAVVLLCCMTADCSEM